MAELIQDVRFAARSLRRAPLFAAVALVTLGAGLGLTLAMFAVLQALLLRPLDYPSPDRLVLLQGEPAGLRGVSMPMHVRFRDHAASLQAAAAWQGWSPIVEDRDHGSSRLIGASVSAEYFDVAGIRAPVGRTFTASDGEPGHEPVVLIAHTFWQQRFGGEAKVVGDILELDGVGHRIVGVAPRGFVDPVTRAHGWRSPEVWRAAPPSFREAEQAPGWVGFWSLGRLRPEASAHDLTAELRALAGAASLDRAEAADAAEATGAAEYARVFRAVTVQEAMVEEVRPTLVVLMGAVIAVLLIACANLANLLLARATARREELAVRSGLGAGRARLLRQLLTESLVLSVLGSLLGLVLAGLAIRALIALAGSSLPAAVEIDVNLWVVGFAAGAAVVTALLFGTAPALRSIPGGPPRVRGGLDGGGLRRTLVVLETALAVALLAGAGVLLRTVLRLESVDVGFEPSGVLAVNLGLDPRRFAGLPEQAEALRRVEESLLALPAAMAAGAITDLPLSGAVNSTRVVRSEDGDDAARERPSVLVRAITPGYLQALGVPVIAGRSLGRADRLGSDEVALVNQTFGRRFFAGEQTLGQAVVVRGVERRIVGVVADVREFDLTSSESDPVLYTPFAQEREEWMRRSVWVALRTTGDPQRLASSARAAVLRDVPGVLVERVRPFSAWVDGQTQAPRLRATLVLAFAALATILAAVGLGGVVAYGVSRRVPEIGLRLALGADARRIQGMMLKETAALAGVGVGLGALLFLALGPILDGFLFAVTPRDPVVLATVIVSLLAVGLAAGWIPACRAARVDPAVTLRRD